MTLKIVSYILFLGEGQKNKKVERIIMQLDNDKEKIRKYLSTMKKMLVEDARLVVVTNKDKNFIFMYLYNLSINDVKNYLLSIKENEFEEVRYSNHPDHIGEELYIWKINRVLTAQDGSEVEEDIYVKTHIDEQRELVIAISFHRYGDV